MGKHNCVIRATDIRLRNGMYTVTLPDDSLQGLCACQEVLIGLYTSIDLDSTCNTVEVTDGTSTLPVYVVETCDCSCGHVADLWRTTLQCRTILVTRYAPSGESLTINGVKGKRGCCA